MNFTITPAAEKFIRLMIRADGDASSGFRLAVSPGGCSGLAADISIKREPVTGDAVVEQNGVKLFLPAESRILLEGVTIDFADTATQTGLVFHDPKQVSSFEPCSLEERRLMMGSADQGEPQSVMDAAVLANALLGGGLPPEAEFHLWEGRSLVSPG